MLDLLKHQQTLNGQAKPSPRKDKIAIKLSRLAKLWIPLGKELVLEGVIIGGATIFTELEKTLHWAMPGNPPAIPRHATP